MDIFYEIWGSMLRNKMRTIATGVAVASGLFLLIVLQGAGNGVIHSFEENTNSFALDAVHVWPGWTSMPFEGMEEGRRIRLDLRGEEMARRRFPAEVTDVSPICSQWGVVMSYGSEYLADVELRGIRPNYQEMGAMKIAEGRALHQRDLDERAKVILLSDKRAEELAPRGKSLLHQYVLVGKQYFLVVGIYEDSGMDSRTIAYAPFTTVQTMFGRGNSVDEICLRTVGLEDPVKADTFETEFRHGMSRVYQFHPKDRRAMWVWNEARTNADMVTTMGILRTGFWILGLLTLLSGVVGVSNIMLIAVKERTHEFGIRKAIGATPWAIIRMVILESVVITALFGYIGMLAGLGFCEYMDAYVGNRTMDVGMTTVSYFTDPTVDVSTCLWATVVLIISGALAGFFPAFKASHVKPIEALHAS